MRYEKLCGVYEKLESTSKRLEKVKILSNFLKSVQAADLEPVTLLLQGLVYPVWDSRKLGFSSASVVKVLSLSFGQSESRIKDLWRETGDLGKAASKLNKTQSTLSTTPLTVSHVFSELQKLASVEGKGSVDQKVGIIKGLISPATSLEAKYVVKSVLDELRVGLGQGTLRDALISAYLPAVVGVNSDEERGKVLKISNLSKPLSVKGYDSVVSQNPREVYNHFVDKVQLALDVCNDFTQVAKCLKSKSLKGLESIEFVPFRPLNVMLGPKADNVTDAFKSVGSPARIEHKLDGFRVQLHKVKDKVMLFTRRLENVTEQFPDIVGEARKLTHDLIIDSEAVGYKDGKYLPFQEISQRIRRKYDIEKLSRRLPVQLHVFDLLYLDGQDLLSLPLKDRQKRLKGIIPDSFGVRFIEQLETSSSSKAVEFYESALKLGLEGVIFKRIDAPYIPGRRVGYMVKMKPTLETLDLVIVSAEWGEGRRSNWLSSYTVACLSEGALLEVGKVSTGMKEKEGLTFDKMTTLLKPLIKSQRGRLVTLKPKVVIEVRFEEIQKSPSYSSGFALRFPRVVRLREDRSQTNCSTLEEIKKLYSKQKGR